MIYHVNDLKIITSDMGRSGYLGVTFSPAWTLNEEVPFIAMAQNPKDKYLIKWLTAKQRQSLHLGYYSDSREAAYVYAMYNDDPENVLKEIYYKTFNPVFPQHLYDLPVFLKLEEAQEEIAKVKREKKMSYLAKEAVYTVARNNVKTKDMKVLGVVRKNLDIGIMNRRYKTENDVINHVNEVMKGLTC